MYLFWKHHHCFVEINVPDVALTTLLFMTVVLGQLNMKLITSYVSLSTANNILAVGAKCLSYLYKKICARTIPTQMEDGAQ